MKSGEKWGKSGESDEKLRKVGEKLEKEVNSGKSGKKWE